jgi:hypothetical protein
MIKFANGPGALPASCHSAGIFLLAGDSAECSKGFLLTSLEEAIAELENQNS